MPEDFSQPTSNQKSINWKNILFVVVIAAVVLGLGVLIFLILQPREEPTTPITTKKATPSAEISTHSAKKDNTEDWKLVENQKIGISIKYPPEWGLLKCGDSTVGLMTLKKLSSRPKELHCQSDFLPTISISRNKAYTSVELVKIWDENNESGWFSKYKTETTTLDQKAGTKVSYTTTNKAFEQPEGTKTVYYLFDIEGEETLQVYYVQYPEDSDYLDIFNKMMETFKFLD